MDIQIQYLIELIKGEVSINIMGTNLSDFKTPSLTDPNLMINRVENLILIAILFLYQRKD